MKLAGLDIGTTGCKCTVFDGAGNYLDRAYCHYPVVRKSEAHVVDVEAIMAGVYQVMTEMAHQHPDIAGIGVTSFGETFVMVDEKGVPLHDAMLYTDPRGKEACAELVEQLGSKYIASVTGVRPHEMYSLPKMMWLKANCGEVYEKATRIFLMADYVTFCLTGRAVIDYSLASRTMGFDIHTLTWSAALFEAAGIDPSLMSEVVPSGTVVGTLKEKLSQQFGLAADTQIVCISHDQVAAAVGAGVFTSEVAVDGAGTVECITPVYDTLPDMDIMYEGHYAVVPYVIPGKYVCYAFSYTGGALIDWCIQTFAKGEQAEALKASLSINAYLEAHAESPTGLLVLPHFAGAATPYMDAGAKGAILGLTLADHPSTIYRACMEGVVYEMVLNMGRLSASGVQIKALHATGGGAKSKVWMQMKADMLNVPITVLDTIDAGTVGSAMLTGVAMGCFKDLEAAAAHMVHCQTTYDPDPAMHAKYQQVYKRYEQVYEAVRPLMA